MATWIIFNGNSSTRSDDATNWSASFDISRRRSRRTACQSRIILRNYHAHPTHVQL